MKMIKLNTIAITGLFALTLAATSCETNSTERLKDAKSEVVKADKNLDEAIIDYKEDMENYRNFSNTKNSENEQSIKDFKARIANSKRVAKQDYDNKISDLEQKNTDLKRKLDEYKLEGKDQWDSFKTEFSHDMDALGAAIKDLTKDNVK